MTEQEWLTCAEPQRMVAYLEERRLASERKLRAYVEACRDLANPEATAWTYDLDDFFHLRLAVEEWALSADSRLSLALRADLFRDLFGNPFREVIRYSWDRNIRPRPGNRAVHFRVEWLTWQNGTIPRMTQQIDDDRDFAALPVLADALEDAGCREEAILRHCRGQGREHRCKHCEGNGWLFRDLLYGDTMTDPCEYCDGTGFQVALHVRGCWCLDLILGKE